MESNKNGVGFDVFFCIVILLCVVFAFCIVRVNSKAIEPIETGCESITETQTEETTEVTQEPIQEEAVETEPPVTLYDVPLEERLQMFIIEQAEAHNIDPAIIFAMAFHESSYNPLAIGDDGDSLGLLQVQERWHGKRMGRMGVDNLLNPYQNVLVAVDFLAELLDRYNGDMEKALTAYNQGYYGGKVTYYTRAVLKTAEELRGAV